MIRFALSNIPLLGFILAFLMAGLKPKFFWERLADYLLLLAVGVSGIWAFAFHAFMPELSAQSIGWSNSPFQFEVAVANLGIGLGGIVAFWRKQKEFSCAICLVAACFLWGAAYGHIVQILAEHDWAMDNAGPVLWMDILIPAVLWLALWRRKNSASS